MHTQSGSLERWIFFSMSHNSSLQEKDLLRDWLVKALPYWPRWALLARCMHWAIQPIPIHCYLNTSTDSPEQGVGISYLNSSCRRDVLIGQFVGSVGCKVRQPQPLSANHIQTDQQVPVFALHEASPRERTGSQSLNDSVHTNLNMVPLAEFLH